MACTLDGAKPLSEPTIIMYQEYTVICIFDQMHVNLIWYLYPFMLNKICLSLSLRCRSDVLLQKLLLISRFLIVECHDHLPFWSARALQWASIYTCKIGSCHGNMWKLETISQNHWTHSHHLKGIGIVWAFIYANTRDWIVDSLSWFTLTNVPRFVFAQ